MNYFIWKREAAEMQKAESAALCVFATVMGLTIQKLNVLLLFSVHVRHHGKCEFKVIKQQYASANKLSKFI